MRLLFDYTRLTTASGGGARSCSSSSHSDSGASSSASSSSDTNSSSNKQEIPKGLTKEQIESSEKMITKIRKTGRDFQKRDVLSSLNRALAYKESRQNETPEEIAAREERISAVKQDMKNADLQAAKLFEEQSVERGARKFDENGRPISRADRFVTSGDKPDAAA